MDLEALVIQHDQRIARMEGLYGVYKREADRTEKDIATKEMMGKAAAMYATGAAPTDILKTLVSENPELALKLAKSYFKL